MIHLEEFNGNMGQSLLEVTMVNENHNKFFKRKIIINGKRKLTSFKIKTKKSELVQEFRKKVTELGNVQLLVYFVQTFYLNWDDTISYFLERRGLITSIYKGKMVNNCQEVLINGEIYSITSEIKKI